MKTETRKLYSTVFGIFLPNIITIDRYNFDLYRFSVGSIFRDTVQKYVGSVWHYRRRLRQDRLKPKGHVMNDWRPPAKRFTSTDAVNDVVVETTGAKAFPMHEKLII